MEADGRGKTPPTLAVVLSVLPDIVGPERAAYLPPTDDDFWKQVFTRCCLSLISVAHVGTVVA